MSGISLRARLTLASGGALALALASFALVAVLLVSAQLRSSLDQALRSRARTVSELAVLAPAVLREPGALQAPVSGPQIAVEVLDARGRIIASSLTPGVGGLPTGRVARRAIRLGRAGFASVSVAGVPERVYAAPIADVGGPAAGGAVLVAAPTGADRRTVARLEAGLSLAALAVLAAALAAVGLLTRRSLAPLRRLAVAAEQIEQTTDPSRRLPQDGAEELARLGGVLNRMLAALAHAREAERRLLADASHELRTPVTTLLGNVEYALRHGGDVEVLDELARDARRLARLVDDVLALERVRAGAGELRSLALDELVRAVVAEHPAAARIAVGPLGAVRVRGDPQELARALSCLLDNAAVHGPPEGPIRVWLAAAGRRVRLSVCDEGPGPDPLEAARLFERFRRGTGAGERPGSGLGLAIVRAVAQRHGGSVEVDGSCFSLLLDGLLSQEP